MTHLTIEPSILYVGTPVELVSTDNGDGTFNLAPMSSAWALGDVVVLGFGAAGQTAHNRYRPSWSVRRAWANVRCSSRLLPPTSD